MKFKFILYVFLITTALNAQEHNRYYWGLNFSPDLCGRTLKNTTDHDYIDQLILSRNESEINRLGFSSGIVLGRTINEKFSIETCLSFSSKGYKTKPIALRFGNQVSPDSTIVDLNNTIQIKYIHQFIELPIVCHYNIEINEDLKSFIGLGFNNQFAVTSYQKFIPSGKKSKEYLSSGKENKYIPGINLSFGINKQLNSRYLLRLNFISKYSLKPIYTTPLEGYLWSFGFNTGIYMSIN